MKHLVSILALTLALFMAPTTFASVRVYNSAGTLLGTYSDLKLANGLAVSQVSGKAQISSTSGDGSTTLFGFRQQQSATSGDLSVADCGKTFTSDGLVGSANGPIDLFNLPTISASTLGCRFTFIVGVPSTGNQQLQVNPQTANQILLLASAAGDAISADAPGESVTLEAIAPGWAPVGKEQGTWSDIN